MSHVMALVNSRKTHHLTSKELFNFKILVLFVIFAYGVALPLWFVLYGHSFLRENDRWSEIVVSKTRVARSEAIDTNHVEQRKRENGQEWRQKNGNLRKEAYKGSENYGIPRPTLGEISSKKTFKGEARIPDRLRHAGDISLKKPHNSETRIPQTFPEIPPDNHGRLLSMKWDQVCCQSVNCLRKYPLFPLLPIETRFLRTLRVSISGKLYAERIFGRVAPPATGTYSFLVKCATTCELWLGENEYPRSSKLFIKIVHGTAMNVTNHKKPNFDVVLHSGRRYFVDILFTVYRQSRGPFEVLWKLPNAGKFSSITQQFFSGFVKTPRSLRNTLSVLSTSPSTRLTPFLENIEEAGEDDDDFRTIGNEKDTAGTFYDYQGMVIPLNTSLRRTKSSPTSSEPPLYLRSCDYRFADLTVNSSLAKYEGVWKTLFSSVYPNDNTGFMMCIGNRYPLDCQGNKRISNETVQKLLSLFTRALGKHNLR